MASRPQQSRRPARLSRGLGALLVSSLVGLPSIASVGRADEWLVVDTDARFVSSDTAGALFVVDPTAPVDAPLTALAAADQGAPFEWILAGTVTPRDGATFIVDGATVGLPTIHRVDCVTGAVTAAMIGAPLVEPVGAATLPDGRIAIVDFDADPSGLGPDDGNGVGHGAVFAVDVRACTSSCPVSVISDGHLHPFGAGLESAFQDPNAIAYDAARGRLIVADIRASAVGTRTCVFAVDIVTGAVSLVSALPGWTAIVGLASEPGGTILAIDTGATSSACTAWRIDPSLPDPAANASLVTGGGQYAALMDVEVSSTGRVVLADIGEWDDVSGTFVIQPAIFEVDAANPDPATNAILVSQSLDLITPSGLAFRDGCGSPVASLGINRNAGRDAASIRPDFIDMTCRVAPWSSCVEQVVDAPLAGLRLAGESAAAGFDSVSFYEHSDAVRTMKLAKSGTDLMFSPN